MPGEDVAFGIGVLRDVEALFVHGVALAAFVFEFGATVGALVADGLVKGVPVDGAAFVVVADGFAGLEVDAAPGLPDVFTVCGFGHVAPVILALVRIDGVGAKEVVGEECMAVWAGDVPGALVGLLPDFVHFGADVAACAGQQLAVGVRVGGGAVLDFAEGAGFVEPAFVCHDHLE